MIMYGQTHSNPLATNILYNIAIMILISTSLGLVPEQKDQVEEETRRGDGHRQEEARDPGGRPGRGRQ